MNLSESHSLIQKEDRELYELLERELRRQEDTLDMVASESIQDDVTLALSGSAFANKTAVGLPGHQRLLGSENIDALEVLAARPSMPSVRFTEFTVPTMTNTAKM